MKEFMGHKKRNYRRRICSESLGDDGEIERQDNDDNYNADGNGEGIQKLNRGEEEKRLIVAVNARVADFTESRGEVDGLLVVSEEGGASADDVIASSSTKNGDDVGGGQTGGRIACGIGFHMLRAMGWTEHTGLGQSGKGMVNPILPTAKAGNLGIGFNATSVFDTQQEAIRQVQKAKREERDRKQMLKEEWP